MKKVHVKLDVKLKRKITDDWLKAFPHLAVYKPMWLLRRNGPVLSGIVLEPNSGRDSYRPVFHVHNLTNPFPGLTQSIRQPLLTVRTLAVDYIRVGFHDNHILEAPERMKLQIPLVLDRNLRLSELTQAYERFFAGPAFKSPYEYQDIVCYMLWCEQPEAATNAFERLVSEGAKAFADPVRNNPGVIRVYQECIERCQQWMKDPGILGQNLEAELTAHELTRIPDYGFSCS